MTDKVIKSLIVEARQGQHLEEVRQSFGCPWQDGVPQDAGGAGEVRHPLRLRHGRREGWDGVSHVQNAAEPGQDPVVYQGLKLKGQERD